MPIEYIKGNIFSSEKPILAHSVNCKGVFGAGMALQIAKRYPLVKEKYLEKHSKEGWKPGDMQRVYVAFGTKIIVNMALQDTYGRTGIHTKLDACENAFTKLFRFCAYTGLEVCMPQVGSGLGGEKWENIEAVLIKCLEPYLSVAVDIYYL